ncbi:hypothetical protein [Rhizobium sp. RU36D]|uniref:hypothetical protein n=1 Tax=Rhizobium sp. RU36D TaxID=1907415 RepID=UPI0009D8B100|nr:hypothetical protein [Rhizobium sp. RU36D]SMD10078.1 hypothetical protein SAMN05880593_12192 [Rhizobium sp. RU36D]
MPSRTDIARDEERGRSFGQRQQPMTPTEVRQGSYGKPVLIVLLGGLLLAMIFWIPVEWWGNSIAPENPANQPPTATAPSPAADQSAAPTPGQATPARP